MMKMTVLLCLITTVLSFCFTYRPAFGWVTVYPIGTTVYTPDKCYNGYTVISYEVGPNVAELLNMNGHVVNEWEVEAGAERAKFLSNGNLLTVNRASPRKIVEYNWEHELFWEYQPPGAPHHDFQRLDNGNTLVLYQEPVPREIVAKASDPARRRIKLRSDAVVEVTPAKEIVWEWHQYEHFDIDWYNPIVTAKWDWTHTNTVQALPENRWYDGGDQRFRPGNVLLSPRSLDTVLIVDRDTKEIVWRYSGTYKGGLSGQHEPHMIEKGLPGAGNILIFDNGASPQKDLAHGGESYVLEIDPVTEEIVWKYENGEKFYSKYRGTVQRLPNANTLICEADGCRIFEVTVEGEIVWEYTVPYPYRIGRAYRYPYHYSPQTEALGRPTETPVVPPAHALTEPKRALDRDFMLPAPKLKQ